MRYERGTRLTFLFDAQHLPDGINVAVKESGKTFSPEDYVRQVTVETGLPASLFFKIDQRQDPQPAEDHHLYTIDGTLYLNGEEYGGEPVEGVLIHVTPSHEAIPA